MSDQIKTKGELIEEISTLKRRILDLEKKEAEYKHIEEALKESEASYRQLFENAPTGIYRIDFRTGKFIKVNDVFRKYLGYSPEEIFSLSPYDILTEESKSLFMERIEKMALGAELPAVVEYEIRDKEGRKRCVQLNNRMIYDADGRVVASDVVVHEITERKRAEEALRKSEEYFRAITENANDVLFILDAKGKITYCSLSTQRIMGYKPQELIGMNALDLIIPEDHAKANKDFGRALRTKDIDIPNSFRVRHKNGSVLIMEGVGKNLFHNPVIAGFVMNVRDVTERKRAEENLRISEEKYRLLVNNMQDALYQSDADGNLTFITPSGASILGFNSVDEVIGTNIAANLYCDSGQRTILLEVLKKEGKVTNYEVKLKRRDGSSFTALVDSHLLYDKDGNIQGVEGIFTDISRRIQQEEQIRNSQKLLNDILQAAPDFSIIATDPDGIITVFNRASELMLGYDADEVVGKKTPIALHLASEVTERSKALSAAFGYPVEGFRVFAAKAELEGSETREWTYVRKDGSHLVVSLVFTVIRSDRGVITGYLGNRA